MRTTETVLIAAGLAAALLVLAPSTASAATTGACVFTGVTG